MRVRVGHTYFSYNFILEGNSAPVCAHCDRLLSVKHILVHCSKFQNQLRKYYLEGKSISAILDDVDVGGLVGYLQDIEVFNLIGNFFFPILNIYKSILF